jgi:raffinose/stachyose/melibiose transport system substrate-binding protein
MQRQVTRRRFLIDGGKAALGASLAGTLLGACGDGGTAAGEGAASWWVAMENAQQRRYFTDHIVRGFERASDVDLEVSFKSIEDIERLIQTALQAGKGPSIVGTPGPSYALNYVDAGLLMPLDQYSKEFNWDDKVLDWALKAGLVEDKLYSLPTSFETLVIFYNKSLFEERGWKPPANRDELEALAAEAQGQGIMPFTAGNAEWRPATEWFVTVFWNHYAGPDALFQALTGELPWTDAVFVDGIELMNEYFRNGWFGGSVDRYFSNRFDTLYSLLGEGKAAMNMEGTWFVLNVNRFFGKEAGNDSEWGWAPTPPLREDIPDPLFELGIGGTISINARAESPDDNAEFLDWYYSNPEIHARAVAEADFQPVPVHYDQDDFPSSIDPRVEDQIVTLSDATGAGNFGYTTWTFWPPKSDTYIYEEMEKVLVGDLTPKTYCAGLNDLFKEELEEGKIPPIIPR